MSFVIRLTRLWLSLAWLALGVWTAVTNNDRVVVRLPPWIELPINSGFAYVFFLMLGAGLASFHFGYEYLRKHFQHRQLRRQLTSLQVDASQPQRRSREPGVDTPAIQI